jgi:hypothetical protein
MYPNCQKIIAFKLFDNGKRPAEISNTLSLKKQTVFRYFQEWEKRSRIIERAAEQDKLRQCAREWIHGCEMEIDQIRRYPRQGDEEKLAKFQRWKRRGEQLLKDPSLATAEERRFLYQSYSA